LRQALPELLERPPFGGRGGGEEAPLQHPVVGAGGLQRPVALLGEDGEPLTAVGLVDGTLDQSVTLQAGDQMGANLYGIARAGGSVWAVGTFVDPTTDNNEILILRGTGNHWTVDPGPNPGSGSSIFGGLTAIDGQLWAAGTFDDGGSRLPLVEHR
jgi:hypothetical protein